MQAYSIIDSAGNIKLSQVIPHPSWELVGGDRMIPDTTPAYDPIYQTCIRVTPVPAEALEVPYTVAYRPLAEVKEIKKAGLNSERDTRESAGFPYMSTTFDSNSRAVQRINTAVQAAQAALAAGSPFSLTWTDANNNSVFMTGLDLVSMPVALAIHADAIHQTCKSLKDLVDAATTPEEVLAVAWPA